MILRAAQICPVCESYELRRGVYRERCGNCDAYISVDEGALSQKEWEALPSRDRWRTSRRCKEIPVRVA